MGHTCVLYANFSKRVNSTRQPSDGTEYECRIKNNTDFKHPVLEIAAVDLSDVNYMQFNGEYFYVTSIVSHRTGIWDVAGQRDPLATYKASIGATSAFLLYGFGDDVSDSARRVPDERLAVSRVPAEYYDVVPITGNVNFSPKNGAFILSAVGSSGGVASYALSAGSMSALLNTLGQDALQKAQQAFGAAFLPADETEALTWIRNGLCDTLANEMAFGSALTAIRDCHWVPFLVPAGTGAEIMLGDFHSGVYGLQLTGSDVIAFDGFTVDIPWPENDWKRNLCQVQIALPLCGVVVIPVDKLNNKAVIEVNVAIDFLGGNLSYEVRAGGHIITTVGANCAVPYAIGSSNVSMHDFISGTMTAVGGGIQAAGGAVSAIMSAGIFGAGDIAGGITSMAQGALQAITPQVQCVGAMGGCSGVALNNSIILCLQYFAPIDEAATQAAYGHPVFSMSTPLAGYNCFRAFSVDCGGSPDEIARINAMFNSGAYYE